MVLNLMETVSLVSRYWVESGLPSASWPGWCYLVQGCGTLGSLLKLLRPSPCFSPFPALVTPAALRPLVLGGNQLVIIVGTVCATILLLPVLILIVKRTCGNKRYRAAPAPWVGRLGVQGCFYPKWKR